MRDLRSQIEAYAEHLDAVATPLDELDLGRPAPDVRPRRVQQRRIDVVVAAGVAAVVVVAALTVAALAFRGGATNVAETTPSATATSAPSVDVQAPQRLALVQEAPVLTYADSNTDRPFTGPGGVLRAEDGTYHMFFSRYGEDDSVIGHAVSADLVSWEVIAEEIVDAADIPFIGGNVHARTAAILPDGRWAVYFDGFATPAEGKAEGPMVIGVATSPGPEGPWSLHAEPVLRTDQPDGGGVGEPSVVAVGNEMLMLYVVRDDGFDGRISRATSDDGFTWVADATPVLVPDREWERGSLTRPNVVVDDGRLVMLYAARTSSGQGFAVGSDAVTWEKQSAEPVLTISDVPRASIKDAELVVGPDGGLYVLVENGGSRTSTDVYLLREAP